MLTKLEASAKLYLLVSVMFVFTILLGFYGFSGMRTLNQNTQTLYQDRVVPLQQLTTIRYSYLNGIISAAEHAHAANFTFSEAEQQVEKTKKTIADNWKAYLLTYLTPEEDKLAKEVSVLMKQSVKTVEELRYALKKGNLDLLDNIIKKELYPAVDPIILKMNELITLQIKIGGNLYQNSSGVYTRSLKKFLLLIMLSLLFAIPFSYYLVRSIKRLIEKLQASNNKIAVSEKKYRNIFENVQDVFYQTTVSGEILDASPSCYALTEWTREELIGRSTAIFYYFPKDRQDWVDILKETGEIKEYETLFKTKTGKQVNVSITASLIKHPDGSPSHIDGTLINITKRKKAEEKLKEYEQKLTKAAIRAQEDERYEIGGELHDNVCQILAGSLIYLGMLKEPLPPGSEEYYTKTYEFISLATNEIRNLSHRLAPALFDDATLEYAFDNLLTDFNIEKKYTISLHFDERSKTYPLSRDLQLSVYRILQEQVRNIFKHAKASRIEVALAITDNNVLQMRIKDNGVGFDAPANSAGIGLANMNRRVQLFSGTLTINSIPGNGCEVLVKIPLAGNS